MILIVEDEPIVRLCAAEMLSDAGFLVVEATTGDHALEILASRTDIATLFTDVEMPGTVNGNALAAIVADRWPDIRIVVTSGRMRPEPEELPAPARFLPKPYMPDELLSAMLGEVDRG